MHTEQWPDAERTARLRERFLGLLERHVSGLRISGNRATGLCPFHDDHNPSFRADLERGVWYCFACGKGGGVRDFTLLVGEGWENTRSESHTTRVRRAVFARRRHTEQQARSILQRRKDEKEDALWAEWCEASNEATQAADLLDLFHRRPDLAAAFPALLDKTEQEYSDALFQRSIQEARIAGEMM